MSLQQCIGAVAVAFATVVGWFGLEVEGRAAITDPTQISGNTLWLDASDLGSITIATGVSSWTDKSTLGLNTVTNVTAGEQPASGVSTQNGLNVLTFDGSNDNLFKTGGTLPLAGNDDNYTYVAVWRPHTTAGFRSLYEQAQAGGSRRAAILQESGSGRYGFNGEGNDRHNLVPYAANAWRITDLQVNNANAQNIEVYDNGNFFSGATGNPAALDVGTLGAFVGRKWNNSEYFDGDIAEIIVYNKTLSFAEHNDVGTYLNNKWNVGASYPIVAPPEGLDAIRHRWSFNDGTMNDSIGTAHGSPENGNVSVVGQRLEITGAGRMLTSTIGDAIGEKTLVVWTSLDDPTISTRGSALTLQNNSAGSVFDAIVYGEADPRNWMNGSNFFARTQSPQSYGFDETVGEPGEVMIAISYAADNSISVYRNGVLYGSYTKGSLVNFDANSLVQIGRRHGTNGDTYLGFINEARIYADALSVEDIALLFSLGPDQLQASTAGAPEPSTLALVLFGLMGMVVSRRRKGRS